MRRGLGLAGATCGTVYLSGGEAGIICRQLHINRRQFCRLTRPAKGRFASELFQFFLAGSATRLLGRPDRSGRNSVHPDALGPKLLGQRFNIIHRGGLRLRIVIKIRRRVIRLLGSGPDDHRPNGRSPCNSPHHDPDADPSYWQGPARVAFDH
jgi:hypothetical protein